MTVRRDQTAGATGVAPAPQDDDSRWPDSEHLKAFDDYDDYDDAPLGGAGGSVGPGNAGSP